MTIGPYEILGELGRGGMGVVYRARHPGLDRVVALKVITEGAYAAPESVARFVAEARLAARMDHPNIVRVYEVGQHEGRAYYTMALVEGIALDTLIADGGRIAPRTALRIATDVARALHYAHSQGVIHRDVKPGNVMLAMAALDELGVADDRKADSTLLLPGGAAKGFRAMIGDFGLAREVATSGRLTASGAILGTPQYMAPEQAMGERQRVGPRSDVYAIGAVLYEMLTGWPPFDGATPLETIRKVVSDEPRPPRALLPALHADVQTIALKALEKDPDRRYATAAELADDCERYLRGEAIRARPRGPLARALRWTWRRRAVTAPLAAAALALAGAAGWAATRPGTLVLRVSPPGARVAVDDRPVAGSGPERRVVLPPGRHVIRAEAADHRPELREVSVARHETREIAFALARETGVVEVLAEPPGEVVIAGVHHGTPLRDHHLPTGPHVLTVEREGHFRRHLAVEVRADAPARRAVSLPVAVAWERRFGNWNANPPTGDADGDGVPDFIYLYFGTRLLAISGATGATLRDTALPVKLWAEWCVRDVDGDGRHEFVIPLSRPEGTTLAALRVVGEGAVWETAPFDGCVHGDFEERGRETGNRDRPVLCRVADLDGDGLADTLMPDRSPALRAFATRDGRTLWVHALDVPVREVRPIPDMDGDGAPDLLVWQRDQIRLLSGRTGIARFVHRHPPADEAQPWWLAGSGEVVYPIGAQFVWLDGATGVERRRAPAVPVPSDNVGPPWELAGAWEADRVMPPLPWLIHRDPRTGVLQCWDLATGVRTFEWTPPGTSADVAGHCCAWRAGADTWLLARHRGDHGFDALDPATGRRRFAVSADVPVGVSAVFPDGPAGPARLCCGLGRAVALLDPATGRETFRTEAPGTVISLGACADTDRDGTRELLYGTREGHLVCVGLDGVERYSARLGTPVAHLALADVDRDALQDVLVQSTAGPSVVLAPRVRWRREFAAVVRAGPVLADVEGDGRPDVLAFTEPDGSTGNRVLALDGREGTVRWTGDQRLDGFRRVGCVDWTGDGVPEPCYWLTEEHRALLVLDLRTGREVARVPLECWGYAEPSSGDLDGDGAPEVVVHGWYPPGQTVAVSTRTRAPLWRTPGGGSVWSGSVLAGVRAGAGPDVFVASSDPESGGLVRCLDGRTGAERWRQVAGRRGVRAGVAVVHLGTDARATVVANALDGDLYLFDAETGEPRAVWPGFGGTQARPCEVDADGDGTVEVLVCGLRGLACLGAGGEVRWAAEGAAIQADPCVADLDADGAAEVVVGDVRGTVRCLDLRTGGLRWEWRSREGGADAERVIEGAPVAADVDGDGALEVIVASHDRTVTCLSGRGDLRAGR